MPEMNIKRPPGKDVMNSWGIAAITIYLLAAIIIIIWTLIALWPPLKTEELQPQTAPGGQTTTTAPGGQTTTTAPGGQTTTTAPGGQTTATAPAGQTPATAPAGQTPTTAPAGQNVTPGRTQPATPSPSATASVSATPTPTPDECAVKHRIEGEFCLNEKGEKRKGVAPANVFWWCGCLYDEDRLLLLVLLAGALGSLIHGLRSFVWYVGNRRAVWSWSAYYVALPFIGAGIAFIFYLVIRGGFFSSSATVENTSAVGFAAIAALIGMFTEQAVQKLKSVSETILAPAEKGKDHIDGPKITSITPKQGPPKGGNEVSIAGENFSTPTRVTFGGVEANVTASTGNSITLLAPAQPDGKEGKVDVVVIGADNQKYTERDGYEYKNDPSPPDGDGSSASEGGAGDEQPVHGEDGDEDAIDGCDVKFEADTPDEELPATEGGVK